MIEIFHFSSIFYHCSVYRASCCEAQGFFYFVTVIWLPEGHYWATYRGKPYSPDVSHSVANAIWPKIPGNLKTIFGPRRVWTCNFRISDFECNTTTAMLPQRPLHCNAMAPQRLLHCIAMVTLAPLGSRKPMFEGLASLSLSLCLSLYLYLSISCLEYYKFVGNEAKGLSKRIFQENRARQILRKTNTYPLRCAYQM